MACSIQLHMHTRFLKFRIEKKKHHYHLDSVQHSNNCCLSALSNLVDNSDNIYATFCKSVKLDLQIHIYIQLMNNLQESVTCVIDMPGKIGMRNVVESLINKSIDECSFHDCGKHTFL